VAAAYAGKTIKTLTRDPNALQKAGLIRRRRNAVSAHKAALRAFLPGRRDVSKRQ